MNIKQSFFLALKSLKQSKLRSFLTMLGVIVGVTSVFAMLTIMNTYKDALFKSIPYSFNKNFIILNGCVKLVIKIFPS